MIKIDDDNNDVDVVDLYICINVLYIFDGEFNNDDVIIYIYAM
jgi:hypothetical protein